MNSTDQTTCERCGGSGVIRNLATLSPADDEPCQCTYEDEESDDEH